MQAKRDQTERAWKRAQVLRTKQAIADTEYDISSTDFRMAAASAAAGVAAIQEAEATLRIAKTNLAYTTIKSPSDGVIIDRRVNVGQTVVASFNAPGLFLIAKDSRLMQVWASVGEADIGDIRPGQPARFTVKACMDTVFDGKVAQIRMNPVRHDAAITYTVVVAAENLGEMLPDMTANLQFEVEHHPGVLLIPNNAISLPPQSPQPLPDAPAAPSGPAAHANDATTFSLAKLSGARCAARLCKEQRMHHHLWVKDGEQVRPIDVQVGSSNGAMTEITGKDVREGMEVVLGDVCRKNGS